MKVKRRRFWCKACRQPFPEGIPWLCLWGRMSRQAEGEALYELRHLSFGQVQAKLRVSYGMLRWILDHGIDEGEVLKCLDDVVNEVKKQRISLLVSRENSLICTEVSDKEYIIEDGPVVFEGAIEELMKSEEQLRRHLVL